MLKNNSNDLENAHASGWTPSKLFTMTLAGTLLSALLGAFSWVILGGLPDRSQFGTAIIFGGVFGGWVGLSTCLLFGLVRKLREYGARSLVRSALIFAVLGAIAASPLFVPFADGWGMAMGALIEAAIFGGIMGGLLGMCLFLMMFRQNKRQNTLSN